MYRYYQDQITLSKQVTDCRDIQKARILFKNKNDILSIDLSMISSHGNDYPDLISFKINKETTANTNGVGICGKAANDSISNAGILETNWKEYGGILRDLCSISISGISNMFLLNFYNYFV